MPISFIPMRGSFPGATRFLAGRAGFRVSFAPEEIRFRLARETLQVQFPGSALDVSLEALDPLPGRVKLARRHPDVWSRGLPKPLPGDRHGLQPRGAAAQIRVSDRARCETFDDPPTLHLPAAPPIWCYELSGFTAAAPRPIGFGRLGRCFCRQFNANGSLVYSSHIGGSGIDSADAIAVDASGGAFFAGFTYSMDLPLPGPTAGGSFGAQVWTVR